MICRQPYPEGAAPAELAGDRDRAAVQRGDFGADEQTEAQACLIDAGGVAAAREGVEQRVDFGFGNADAVVLHFQLQVAAILTQAHVDLRLAGRVLQRIAEQVGQNLGDAVGVPAPRQRGVRRDAHAPAVDLRQASHGALDQLAEFGRLRPQHQPAGLDARDVQHLLNQLA